MPGDQKDTVSHRESPHEIKTFNAHGLNRDVAVIVGTRPGIVMFAPIIHEMRNRRIPFFLIHTSQHYSPNMDADFFADLEIPRPDYRLKGVAEKKTHGGQTAAMLEGIEEILLKRRPCLTLVGGDANTNLAGALAARKLQIKVGHIEAGERSYDWQMPEEHNRVIIDHISDHLFVTNDKSVANLLKEGIKGDVHVTGNPIVDASCQHVKLAKRKSKDLTRFGVAVGSYAVMTLHREENVDNKENLCGALRGVSEAAQSIQLPVLFFAHPRTQKRMAEFEIEEWTSGLSGLAVREPVGYLDFLALLAGARLIFTDSGGVQQEACIMQVPCVTLRDSTEWTETLEDGANRLAGCKPACIVNAAASALAASGRRWAVPFGDGNAAKLIADVVERVIDDVGR